MTRNHRPISYYCNVCHAIKSILYTINIWFSLLIFNQENFPTSYFLCKNFFPIVNEIREKYFINHLPSPSDLVWDNNLTPLNLRLFHSGYFNFLNYLKSFMSKSEWDIFKLYRYYICFRLFYTDSCIKFYLSQPLIYYEFRCSALQQQCYKWIVTKPRSGSCQPSGLISLGPLGHEHPHSFIPACSKMLPYSL